MRRKDIRKRKGIRYAEYYNMVEIQDELYRQGMMKKKFYHLMPIIASPQNIRLAYRNLKNNKGSNTPGVDGKTFADYAKLEDVELIRKVQEKLLNYQPKAVRRVYIPKSNGKLRPLGIPTVLDRLVQQSILQVLEPVCESKFHRYSYGFRPNRSCKQAVAMCYKLAQVNGYHYVVDVDIKGCASTACRKSSHCTRSGTKIPIGQTLSSLSPRSTPCKQLSLHTAFHGISFSLLMQSLSK